MSHDIERARSALWSLDPGLPRGDWVKIGMAAKDAGLDFDDFHEWSAGAGNYRNEADCKAAWASFKSGGGVTASSLFNAAFAAGWKDNKPHTIQPTPAAPFKWAIKPTESTQAAPKEEAEGQPQGKDPGAIWDACKPATAAHWYVAQKAGKADGLRVHSSGALVLPVHTLAGELASLQFIQADGRKVFLSGVKLPADGCLIIGGAVESGPVYLVEGIGQAWSANKATNCPAVVCFGWSRVAKVAQAIKAASPAARLVIVPDAGKEADAEAIAGKVGGSWVEMPPGSPPNADINDIEMAQGVEAVRAILTTPKEKARRFQLLTPSDIARLPRVRWLIRDVLPESGIASIYGPSASGKSFLALDMLAHVAGGREWFGQRVRQAPCVYVALEGAAGLPQRVEAWRMKNGPFPEAFRLVLSALDIRNPNDTGELIHTIQTSGMFGGVVVLDTLAQSAPGMDENTSGDMGEVIAACQQIQGALGGLVLLVHHTGKDATKGARGHSSFYAALDAAVCVIPDPSGSTWTTESGNGGKSKDGGGISQGYRLEVIDLGNDEEGEPITSCVIAPSHKSEQKQGPKLPSGGNQKIAWEALGPLFQAAGTEAPEGAPDELPPGRPCLVFDDAVEKIKGRLPVEAKRQKERASEAIKGLTARGLLVFLDGFIWCS